MKVHLPYGELVRAGASSPYAIFASVNPILTLVSSGLGYLGGMIEAVG